MNKIRHKAIPPESRATLSVSVRKKLARKFKKDIRDIVLTKLDKKYISGLRYKCEEEDLLALMEIEMALHKGYTVEFYEVEK